MNHLPNLEHSKLTARSEHHTEKNTQRLLRIGKELQDFFSSSEN